MSIVLPTSGDRHSLTEALRSVLAQSEARWECIVVLDGPNLVAALPADERIRFVRHVRPYQGPGAARNTGMACAAGTWVTFLDDDDLLAANRLEHAVLDIGGAAVHLCGLQRIGERGEEMGRASSLQHADDRSIIRNPPHVGQALVRRELALQFNPTLRLGEDVEWWIRMASAGSIVTGPSIGYLQRRHPGERIGADPKLRYTCRRAIVAMHGDVLARDRQALAYHRNRVAAAALLSGAPTRCMYWAAAAMVARPSWLSAKLLARGLMRAFT